MDQFEEEDELIHVGARLKELIQRRGITMSQVAREIGETPQRVSKLLFQENMTTDTLQRLLYATGITWAEVGYEVPGADANVVTLYRELVNCQKQVIYLQSQLKQLAAPD